MRCGRGGVVRRGGEGRGGEVAERGQLCAHSSQDASHAANEPATQTRVFRVVPRSGVNKYARDAAETLTGRPHGSRVREE